MLSFILWEGSPTIFSSGTFSLKWYAIFVILGVIAGRQMFNLLTQKDASSETVIFRIIILSIIGARLVHVLLNDPAVIFQRPWEALLPMQISHGVRFVGLSGLSGHGAILGVILACWLSRKKIAKYDFLKLMDSALLSVALAGVFIFGGLFMNGETSGKMTGNPLGVVTTRPVLEGLATLPCCIMRTPGGKNPLRTVEVNKGRHHLAASGNQPLVLKLTFQVGLSEQTAKEFIIGDVKEYLYRNRDYISEPGDQPINFTLKPQNGAMYVGNILTAGIARHPIYLYQALGFLVMFVFLYRLWKRKNVQKGLISALFLTTTGSLFLSIASITDDAPERSRWYILVSVGFVIAGFALFFKSNNAKPAGTSRSK